MQVVPGKNLGSAGGVAVIHTLTIGVCRVETKELTDKNKIKEGQVERRRGGAPRALAQFVPKLTEKALGKRGLAHANLVVDWPSIVGAEFSFLCQPEKLVFPPGERVRGILHLRAYGPAALEVQHDAPRLLERINGYFGYRAVQEFRLLQALPSTPAKQSGSGGRRILERAEIDALEDTLADIEDSELRETLGRLGVAILSESRKITKK